MKKIIIVPFFLILISSFSQVTDNFSIVKFNLDKKTGTITIDPEKPGILKFPIKFIFDANFDKKNVKLTNYENITLASKVVKFGDENLQKDGNKNTYIIEIDKDRIVNPGGDKINATDIVIHIEKVQIKFSLSPNDPKPDDPKVIVDKKNKEDEYESGYIYYDVMKLLNKNSDNRVKLNILNFYGVNSTTIGNNEYLNDKFGGLYADGKAQGGGGSLIGNLGNTDVTNFAAGLARFLAERAKEEINEAFFIRMKEQLNAYPELKTVFPKTVSYLDRIETYAYFSILNALKEAFEMDIQNLPENLYNIKSLTVDDCDKIAICGKDKECNRYNNCQERLKKLADFFASQNGHWVALGMFSVKEGIQSTNPSDLIKSIVSSKEFIDLKSVSSTNKKYDDYNIASCIELSNFISQSLTSKEEKQIWISTTELNSLFNTKDAFKVYLGLLLSFEVRANDKKIIKFYSSNNDTITFGEVLKKVYRDYKKYEPQVTRLIKNTYVAYNATNNAVKKMIIASEKSIEADPQALYDYYGTLTSSLKPVAHNPLLIALIGKDIGVTYDKVEQFLTPSVDMAYHISTRKYSAAIYDASILLEALNDLEITEQGKTKKYDGFKPVTKSFLKYGTLISTVANAESSDDVKKALEASVLPAGSYSIKRNSKWSLTINSYVGAYWSYANKEEYLPSLGLSAPVGFNISKGFSKTGNYGGLSLNLQVIDIGALVNYYLLKGDTASIPNDFKVRLSNIFAPGFNVCYNIPKTPLSLAWGGQYISTLYKYEQINGQNELTPTNAFRMQVSLLIDIPLYNIKVWDFKK